MAEQHSASGWFNRGESSASGVQGLASRTEAINLFDPYGTNQYYEPSLQRMRIFGAANAATTQVQQHHHHHPIGIFLGSPGGEQGVWSRSHHNLEPHYGRWVSMAKDRDGSRRLQKKIDRATPQEIDIILEDLRDHWHDLIKHPFGKHVIQKFFQSTNITMAQMNTIILHFIIMDEQNLKDVCIHYHGNRVIQKMLEKIKTLGMQIYAIAIIYAMKPIAVALMKNVNGGYVLQQCLELFPSECVNVFLDEVAKNFVDIARHDSGCCVIQDYLKHVEGEALSQLADKIILDAVVLAQDPYGNYVVQFLVKKKIMQVNAMLISQLRCTYVGLSMNKYGSNVVEVLLQYSEMKDAAVIVQELLCSLGYVIVNPYGNYVVQTALKCTKGFLRVSLCNNILSNENLHNHPFGERVISCARAILRSVYKRSQNSI